MHTNRLHYLNTLLLYLVSFAHVLSTTAMDPPLFFPKAHTKTHMATDQITPRENTIPIHIKEVHIEKDIVPKMTSHFESLAEKSKESDPKVSVTKESSHANVDHGVDKQNDTKRNKAQKHGVSEKFKDDGDKNMASMNVGKFEVTRGKEKNGSAGKPSLEEISKARAEAQQASNEAIRAAEERFYKAKEGAGQVLSNTTEYVAETGGKAKDTVVQGARATGEFVGEKGKKGYEAAKDAAVSAGQGVKEGSKSAVGSVKGMAEYAGEKAGDIAHKAKEMVVGEAKVEKPGRKREIKEEIEEEQEDEGKITAAKLYDMDHHPEQKLEGKLGGIIGAIGETIVEIAQTTRDLVLGKGNVKGEKQEEVYDLGYRSHKRG